jgi:hypothetical protein
VEFLGIGIYGNRCSALETEVGELGDALVRFLGDGEEARRMRQRAKGLAEVCIACGGRRAADRILECAESGYGRA